MESALTEFSWPVPEGGHQWIEAASASDDYWGKEEFLVEKAEPRSRKGIRLHYPLRDHPALFKTFAYTDPNTEGILRFADRYGVLGGPCSMPLKAESGDKRAFQHRIGELFKGWYNAIYEMKNMVLLWDPAQQEDEKGLSRYIKWDQDLRRVYYESDPMPPPRGGVSVPLREHIAGQGAHDRVFSHFPAGKATWPAKYYLQHRVNLRLGEYKALPRLAWDRSLTGLSLQFIPDSLIAALWLQFAQAISEDRGYRQCEECGTWFELTGQRRADTKYCSGACRSRAYRKRRTGAV